jgi:hypothetical protein
VKELGEKEAAGSGSGQEEVAIVDTTAGVLAMAHEGTETSLSLVDGNLGRSDLQSITFEETS